MINNIQRWETSPFGAPEKPGVYAVCSLHCFTNEIRLLYIGSSKNIRRRIMHPQHPYRILTDVTNYPVIIFTKFKECDNYIELEKTLIKRLKPHYNITHKYTGWQIDLKTLNYGAKTGIAN